jgi:hypothetical protein
MNDTNEPAFPEEFGCDPGMTLRDYFAAKAMQGMLSVVEVQAMVNRSITMEELANASYEWADKMLEARGGEK